ncbi:cyclic GMP-AMP synthase-like isoform X2 [Clarias gariepinus]|uniref:cyclic GMP-AMP synthase-like isoform X2 n=1 Tax=Clarias gariepinus TaxID=13013 RepID=UPI00234D3D55|nr:cyclic GMP-AMP synthase-like isoform X2 [Clarias gariepinus]
MKSNLFLESWRISFSHIKKEIIRYHGNKRTCCEGKQNECCRKLCLRLLKCLFEGLKQRYPSELDALCSYHGKTAFFHNLSKRFEDSLWTPGQLSVCFMKLLCQFESAVNDGYLPHFFVPDHDLFFSSSFPKRSLLFLGNALREQRESGLPLLRVPDPVPALCYSPALQVQAQENALEPENCDNVKTGRRFFSSSPSDRCFHILCHYICTLSSINLTSLFTVDDNASSYLLCTCYTLINLIFPITCILSVFEQLTSEGTLVQYAAL